jgi:hypothetical protein
MSYIIIYGIWVRISYGVQVLLLGWKALMREYCLETPEGVCMGKEK